MTHPPYITQTRQTLSTLTADERLKIFQVARLFDVKDVRRLFQALRNGAAGDDLINLEMLEGCVCDLIRMYDKRARPGRKRAPVRPAANPPAGRQTVAA